MPLFDQFFSALAIFSNIRCRHCDRAIVLAALLAAALALGVGSSPAGAQFGATVSIEVELAALKAEREELTQEMKRLNRTLATLLEEGISISESKNPEVHQMSAEVVNIKRSIIKITEREVQLLQQKIAEARVASTLEQPETQGDAEERYTPLTDEEDRVARLLTMLAQFYAALEEALANMPDPEELARIEAEARDAATLAKIPFSAEKVRLSGAEGKTALAQITERLNNAAIPEPRREISPICSVRTRQGGSLVSSANRSLKPVGKNHYIARLRLAPGDTELRVRRNTWMVRLPEDTEVSDYLITLYTPPGGTPELHVISVADLLAQEVPYIPDWLPPEIGLELDYQPDTEPAPATEAG